MADELLRRILQRLDAEPPLFYADEVQRHFGASWPLLLGAGWMRALSPARVAPCPECGYVTHVAYLADRRTGGRRAYLPCRQCGAVEVSLDQLARWSVDLPGFLRAIAAAAGIRGEPADVAGGRLWHLGHATWAGRPRDVYFVRNYDLEFGQPIVAALTPHPLAVVLLPTEGAVRAWAGATLHVAVALESVLRRNETTLSFDRCLVEGRLTEASGVEQPKGRRTPRKRASRAAKIEALTRDLQEHLRAARDHALWTRQQTGTPELLPRPTQKELAARTGLTATDVSRCFHDKAARELRVLWDLALDVSGILDHGGPRPRRRRKK